MTRDKNEGKLSKGGCTEEPHKEFCKDTYKRAHCSLCKNGDISSRVDRPKSTVMSLAINEVTDVRDRSCHCYKQLHISKAGWTVVRRVLRKSHGVPFHYFYANHSILYLSGF